jgi:iron complex transport system ATP-binding protein
VNTALLALHDVSVGYRQRRATTVTLSDVTASLRRGELVALIGPNGAGKSTLLRSVTGVQAPLAGEVVLDGCALDRLDRRERARRIAVVLSDRLDAPGFSVRDVVALGRHPHTGWDGVLDDDDNAAVDAAIEATGLAPLATRRISTLSDGERQRVAVARAVAQEPELLVLDEPTAYLDPRARVGLISLLRRLTTQRQFTVVVATHDLDLVVPHADQVWIADTGQLITGTVTDTSVRERMRNALGASVVESDDRILISYSEEFAAR